MEGTWIEIRVITKSEALEPVSGIFYGLDCKGVAIEDPNDILEREQGPLTWDFADINVLEHISLYSPLIRHLLFFVTLKLLITVLLDIKGFELNRN